MIRPLALTLAALLALPAAHARAQNPTGPITSAENVSGQVTAVCTPGRGCACHDAVSPQEILWIHDNARGEERMPDGWAGDVRTQTVVIDLGSGQVYRSDRPRAAINAAYGGQGECEPPPRPVADIVPLDGTWRWRTLGERVTGCPAGMAQALAAGLAANRVDGQTRRVAWGGAFHPDRLADSLPQGATAPFDWRRLGPNRWLADNNRHQQCSDGNCVDLSLAMSMGPTSPERVAGLVIYRSRIDAPGAGAILAQLGMAACQIRVRFEIRRTGG
jgi:hypothetical protein